MPQKGSQRTVLLRPRLLTLEGVVLGSVRHRSALKPAVENLPKGDLGHLGFEAESLGVSVFF